jgi:hypothetical protein
LLAHLKLNTGIFVAPPNSSIHGHHPILAFRTVKVPQNCDFRDVISQGDGV